MTIAAAVCFVLAATAEILGIVLVVTEIRKAQDTLRKWRGPASVRDLDEGPLRVFRWRDQVLTGAQQDADDEVIAHLLGSQTNRWTAVGLLVAGVVLGTLGNFLSLSW